MYRDLKQWTYIRRLVLEEGHTRRGLARETGLSRKTIRKMLISAEPPCPPPPLKGTEEKLLQAACRLSADREVVEAASYRRRSLYLWARARDLTFKLDRRRGAQLLRDLADIIHDPKNAFETTGARLSSSDGLARPNSARTRAVIDREYLDRLLRGKAQIFDFGDPDRSEGLSLLWSRISNGSLRQRKKAIAIVARQRGISIRAIAGHLSMSRVSVRKYIRLFAIGGTQTLFAIGSRIERRRANNESVRNAVFGLLHEPPSAAGINRTTWRMADLVNVLREQGTPVCAQIVREITRSAGWRWRKARKVLTSNDPEYRQKVNHIKTILGDLEENEAFFSIDEFGPFSIRAQGGRKLVPPGDMPTVPQYQKSRGSLIMTAALELSRNQVTHFYSPRKDTGEMLRMLAHLLEQYHGMSRIYLSWDAASWHMSKMLNDRVAAHNEAVLRADALGPTVALAPLPAGAQFLNVIESVFSGMARAIIANSNYGSIEEARAAIDRYVEGRNEKFRRAPKRAGRAIWGLEREPPRFATSNNCKDPRYR